MVSGPSGSGKTTLCRRLLLRKNIKGRLVKSVSITTRPRRPDDKIGKDYRFVSKSAFLKSQRQGKFLETQKVFGFLYGTPKDFVAKALKNKKSVLLCIDVKGARAVKRIYKDAVMIFVLSPTLESLETRLKKRSSETKERLRFRLGKARWEIGFAKNYDYIIINDKLNLALKKLETIVKAESLRRVV